MSRARFHSIRRPACRCTADRICHACSQDIIIGRHNNGPVYRHTWNEAVAINNRKKRNRKNIRLTAGN